MSLRRELGLPGAVLVGLGSILGTGVFVSLGLAAGVAGSGVLLAVGLAAGVATCNGLSSARLAASHPVSGGTYEYGYRYLSPWLGFAAGWTFLCAKSASAATAALGVAGYVAEALGLADPLRVPLALGAVAGITALAASGLRRSNAANAAIVTLALGSLAAFAAAVFASGRGPGLGAALADPLPRPGTLLHATALVFVAFTGYGRIATMGEEVREPERTIPRAVIATLVVSAVVYLGVAAAAIAGAGAADFAAATAGGAPLERIARERALPAVPEVLAVGALAAMLGVLLNLVLGLSRVALAMGRRSDLPRALAATGADGQPRTAVLATGAVVAALVLPGDVAAAWSFSAFTVLLYYAVTNLAALRLPDLPPALRVSAVTGLLACLVLASQVDVRSLALGLAVLAVGLAGRGAARLMSPLSR